MSPRRISAAGSPSSSTTASRRPPTIQSRITDNGQITGVTREEVNDLTLILKSGALPAQLTYLEERTIGPSLGADSIRSGVTASIVGLLLIVAFMLIYYKLSGVNAVVALIFNLVILLGLMAYIGAVMTLPGIAGFVLTMGIGRGLERPDFRAHQGGARGAAWGPRVDQRRF
jgi:preprotein translocase subunit SecD